MTITATAVFLLGVFGPAIVALLLTAISNPPGAVSELIRAIARWPSSARWYVFAVGYFAAVKLTAAALHQLVTGSWPGFGETPWYLMVGGIMISTPVQAGEEIGWRGYALPRLTARIGLGPASILLGIVWALWHLPLFFIPGTGTAGQSFPAYLTTVTGLSVAMAWLYWRTDGSLFMTMLMHAAFNNTKDVVPTAGRPRLIPLPSPLPHKGGLPR